MYQSLFAVIGLCILILIAPFWVTAAGFFVAVIFFRFRILFLLPALFADAWYTPVRDLRPEHNIIFLGVAGLILIFNFLIKTTRLGVYYGVEKK